MNHCYGCGVNQSTHVDENVHDSISFTGTDLAVSEKANQLCSACDLPSPNLFVMPYVERPEGYINR